MADRKLLEMMARAGLGEYATAKRDMMNASRGIRDAADQRIAERLKGRTDERAREYRGMSPGERNTAFAEYKADNPQAAAGMKTMAQKARGMAEAAPYAGAPVAKMVNLADQGLRQLAANNAAPGMRGDLSRGATVAGITGGITASGAALIDLMKFLAQGQSVDAERENVLPS